MRQKIYYTADEITNNLYTTGSQWMTEDTVEYIGLYHTYITGEIYTQSTWDKNTSKKLITYKILSESQIQYNTIKTIKTEYDPLQSKTIIITKEDINNGMITRFIAKKNNENKFYETDLEMYRKWIAKTIDPNLYTISKLKWIITGNINDTTLGTVTVLGVSSKNQLVIDHNKIKMPGIDMYLTNTLEYYIDTDIVTPTDINGLDS